MSASLVDETLQSIRRQREGKAGNFPDVNVFCDTSVLLFCGDHPHHEASIRVVERFHSSEACRGSHNRVGGLFIAGTDCRAGNAARLFSKLGCNFRPKLLIRRISIVAVSRSQESSRIESITSAAIRFATC